MKWRYLLLSTFVFILLFLAACDDTIDSNMSEEIADFEFTTQDNEALSLQQLEGKWWIANFMYTNCTIICPTTTPNMASVQSELQSLGLGAQFISFTVDPDHDTPKVLKEYAEEYQVDLSNWLFLTGYSFEEIQQLSNHTFKTALEGGGPDGHEFVHSTSFFLVNPDGEVVKKYDGVSQEEMELLVDDLKTVLK